MKGKGSETAVFGCLAFALAFVVFIAVTTTFHLCVAVVMVCEP